MKKENPKRGENGKYIKGNQSGKQFKKENKPWNKGMKKIHLHPLTEFKEGENVGKDSPSWKGGVQTVKNDGVYLWTGCNSRVRRSRKVYEDVYGKIPAGYIIYHLDGNKFNDDPENLECISRGELMKRNAKGR